MVRTSEPTERLAADNGVRSYKRLALVEQAFRCVKGIDLLVRPIHHRTADRVRAHILLCLLAFYVEWHLRQVWEPLLFEDEELTEDRRRRDPVAPAQSFGIGAPQEEDAQNGRRSAGAELSNIAGSPGYTLS